LYARQLATGASLFTIFPQRSSRGSCWALAVGIPSFPARDSVICLFFEHNCVIVVAIRLQQRPYDVAMTRCLPKQCRNNGIGACAMQNGVHPRECRFAAKTSKTLSEVLFTYEICHIR
jgi:hypothetical protein